MEFKGLVGFEKNLRTLLVGVNSLLGGDHRERTNIGAIIAWFSNGNPRIYNDPTSELLRKHGGVIGLKRSTEFRRETIDKYLEIYELQDIPYRLRQNIRLIEEHRRLYFRNLILALELMLDTVVAIARDKPIPPFETRYKAATTLDEVILIDEEQARKVLQEALGKAGYEVKPSSNLRDAFTAWLYARTIKSKYAIERARGISEKFLESVKETILTQLSTAEIGVDITKINLDSFTFETVSRQPYIGFSSYKGGKIRKGVPNFNGLLVYNSDVPVTLPGLYLLCAHEVIPGHYLELAISDLLYRKGHLGFEATFRVLGTPSAMLMEGMAQNALELLYGSQEGAIERLADSKEFENDLRVHFAHADLFEIALNNAAILYQRDRVPIKELTDYLARRCVLPDHLITMARTWAEHPILGPMQGPAYYQGKRVVGEAIREYGPLNVARVGLNLEGVSDIQTFQRRLQESRR